MSNGREAASSRLTASRPTPSSGGGGPDITIDIGIPIFIDPITRIFDSGDRRNRSAGGRQLFESLFKAPTPQTPFPPIEQFPAPRVPQTPVGRPPPVFGSGELGTRGGIFRAALGRVVGVIGAAIFIRDLLRQFEDEESLERARERQADIEGVLRRGRIDLEPRVIDLPPAVAEPLPEAQPDVIPDRPVPVVLPEIPLEDAPLEVPLPSLPVPAPPIPQVAPETPVTRPLPLPAPSPVPTRPVPLPLPDFFVLPQLPFASPLRPSPRIVADPDTLTPIQSPRIPSPNPTPVPFTPLASPQPSAPPGTPTRTGTDQCEIVERRRRRRNRCREGFFREFADGTQFITWRSRRCDSFRFPSLGI